MTCKFQGSRFTKGRHWASPLGQSSVTASATWHMERYQQQQQQKKGSRFRLERQQPRQEVRICTKEARRVQQIRLGDRQSHLGQIGELTKKRTRQFAEQTVGRAVNMIFGQTQRAMCSARDAAHQFPLRSGGAMTSGPGNWTPQILLMLAQQHRHPECAWTISSWEKSHGLSSGRHGMQSKTDFQKTIVGHVALEM